LVAFELGQVYNLIALILLLHRGRLSCLLPLVRHVFGLSPYVDHGIE